MTTKVKLRRTNISPDAVFPYSGSVKDMTPGIVYDAVQYEVGETTPDGVKVDQTLWWYTDDAGDDCVSFVKVHDGVTLEVA